MSDLAIVAATAKANLAEIVKQAHTLGAGLQSVAPAEKTGTANPSALYLMSTAEQLANIVKELDHLISELNQPPSLPSS